MTSIDEEVLKVSPSNILFPIVGALNYAERIELDTMYELWFNENPVQYSADVELKSKGETIEAYRLPVAFRKIEVSGDKMLLNGLLLKIRGVNRHEFSADQGYVVSREQMIEELKLMKQANINFVEYMTCNS